MGEESRKSQASQIAKLKVDVSRKRFFRLSTAVSIDGYSESGHYLRACSAPVRTRERGDRSKCNMFKYIAREHLCDTQVRRCNHQTEGLPLASRVKV